VHVTVTTADTTGETIGNATCEITSRWGSETLVTGTDTQGPERDGDRVGPVGNPDAVGGAEVGGVEARLVNLQPAALGHHQLPVDRERGGDDSLLTLEDLAAARARNLGAEVDRLGRRHRAEDSGATGSLHTE
jgi:hypothetical protein